MSSTATQAATNEDGSGQMTRAVLLMASAAVLFGLMSVAIRLASHHVHLFEIAFFRNFFGLLFALPLLAGPGLGLLRTRRVGLYGLRCGLGLAAMLCSFWALVYLPLSQAVAISYSMPLFVTIGAVLFLHEVVRLRRWSAVVIGFLGVLLILRPGTEAFSTGHLIALSGAALAACAYIAMKSLLRTEPADAAVIWMVLILSPLSLIPALFVWQWPGPTGWLWLVCTGLFGTLAQMCLTRATRLAELSALIPLNFIQLPVVAVFAWLLFGEHIDTMTVLGAAVIIAATVYIARREARLARRELHDS